MTTGSKPRGLQTWQMLHPGSVVVNLLPQAWRFVRNFWPLMFAWLAGRSNREFALFDLTVVGFLIAMTGGRTLLHFATLRYRVTHQGLEIRSGLLNRQHRILPPERIHNVERVQGPLHRVFGLVEVRIETASGDEVEGMLSALSVEQAVTLMTALKESDTDPEHTEPAAPLRVLHRTPVRDLLMYGISSTRLGAIAIVLGFTLEAMQWSDPERIEEVGRMFDGVGMVFLIVAIVSGTWLFGVVNSLIRHWNVRLVQDSNRLITEEGLLTRRRSELPQEKIQLLLYAEPFLRRLFGFGSVRIETAAAGSERAGVQRAEAFLPVVEPSQLDGLAQHAVPGVCLAPEQLQLNKPAPKALHRSIFQSVIESAILTAGAVWWFGLWGWTAAILLPINIWLGWMDHTHQGWSVSPQYVIARRGFVHRKTHVIPRSKLQSLDIQQGPMMRRWGLSTVVLRVAGTSVAMPLLTWEDAQRLQHALIQLPSPQQEGT